MKEVLWPSGFLISPYHSNDTARPKHTPCLDKDGKNAFLLFCLDSYSALSVNQFVCISLTFCLNWLVCLGVWGVMSCVMEPKYGVCGVQRLLAAHNLYSEGCWSTDVVEALNITNQNWFQLLTYLTKWASFRFIVILSSIHAWRPQGCVKFWK